MSKGYSHPEYAASLSEFGKPQNLIASQSWILEREIPGTTFRDCMGCYPMLFAENWNQLAADLDQAGRELVSAALVPDPFGRYSLLDLLDYFDLVIPFRQHFVTDLQQPLERIISSHHFKYLKTVLKKIDAEKCLASEILGEKLVSLHLGQCKQQSVTGIRRFSRESILRQMYIPGAVLFQAFHRDETHGIALCFEQDQVVYGHILSMSPAGRKLGVSYALYWTMIKYFKDRVSWIDWGGGAGIIKKNPDGLSEFKAGWSTGTKTAYFCGKIFNYAEYEKLSEQKGTFKAQYFPTYRLGEMGR